MSVLTPVLHEMLARIDVSTVIGVLNRRRLRLMCLYDFWPICAGQPRVARIAYTMRPVASRDVARGRSFKGLFPDRGRGGET